jgi:toxin CcdB
MAQWDVYRNPSARSRDEVPYVVDVQSDLLDMVPTRMVVPLTVPQRSMAALPPRLVPQFDVGGQKLQLVPQEAAALPGRLLGQPVHSLRRQAHRIIDALDTVVSGV